MTNIVIVADPHIGCDRWPLTLEEYGAPLREAAAYAKLHKAVLIIAGDLYHHRDPSSEARRFVRQALEGNDALVIDGNHDSKPNPGSAPATERDGIYRVHRSPELVLMRGLEILALPWPHYTDFLPASDECPKHWTIEDQLTFARERLMAQLRGLVAATETGMADLLVGHAHLMYGSPSNAAEAPTLLAGRDVLLDAAELSQLAGFMAFGHVHDSDASFYVGSTQPTDFADTGEKHFLHLTIGKGEAKVRWVPYETSFTVQQWEFEADTIEEITGGLYNYEPIVTFGRMVVRHRTHEGTLSLAEAEKWLAAHAERPMGVSVIPQRGERRSEALVAKAEAEGERLDLSTIPDALRLWARSKDLDERHTGQLLEELEAIDEQR